MDVVKRLLGLSNCHGEKLIDGRSLQEPCFSQHQLYYLGYVFSDQPDSSEIQRAVRCLSMRQRKAFLISFYDDTMIGVQEDDVSKVIELMMHRVVFSCVESTNQKIVAVFYHNPSNPRRDMSRSGLECHLFQSRSKDHARKFAERISDELIFTYRRRRKLNMVEIEKESTRAFSKYVNYENWKPEVGSEISCQNNNQVFSGSTSTFSKSNATMASIETDNVGRSSSNLWASLQDVDLPGENIYDPSSVPKPGFYELPVHVHNASNASMCPSTMSSDPVDQIIIRTGEFSCLVDMAETDI